MQLYSVQCIYADASNSQDSQLSVEKRFSLGFRVSFWLRVLFSPTGSTEPPREGLAPPLGPTEGSGVSICGSALKSLTGWGPLPILTVVKGLIT